MNQTQKVYIRKRIEGILQSKLAELRKKLTVQPKTLSPREKIDMIYTGKVKLKPRKDVPLNVSSSLYVTHLYDFTKYETRGGIDQEKFSKIYKTLKKEADTIIDNVMLGDAEEALKLIQNFEDMSI
jgi:hypothetical protein